MGLLAFSLILAVILPMLVGFLAGKPLGYWVWAGLVTVLVVGQSQSGEKQFFTLVVFMLGLIGAVFVLLGVRLRRTRATRRTGHD